MGERKDVGEREGEREGAGEGEKLTISAPTQAAVSPTATTPVGSLATPASERGVAL